MDATEAAPATCAPLDAGGPTVYSALGLDASLGDAASWSVFDIAPLGISGFSGGVFDDRYVYFAGRGDAILRYDTQAAFTAQTSWIVFFVSSAPFGSSGGFEGAVYDGRYVYFIPDESAGPTYTHLTIRYDTTLPFNATTSWTQFDMSTLADSGAPIAGYAGGTFDGTYVYYAPRANDAGPFGRVARYDTRGAGIDAGDAATPNFDNAANWSLFDLTTLPSTQSTSTTIAVGFFGAMYDGTWVYFVPQLNDAFGGVIRGGESSIVARVKASDPLQTSSSWQLYDMSAVSGEAADFIGAGFDGRYVYFVPQANQIVTRFDTTTSTMSSTSNWSQYDLAQILPPWDATIPRYSGAVFDGRFMYFVPAVAGFGTLVRYDTTSTFTSDCAWSLTDLTAMTFDGLVPQGMVGAIFDGQYVYLVPATNTLMLRFEAKTPPSMPDAGPFYNGSFL